MSLTADEQKMLEGVVPKAEEKDPKDMQMFVKSTLQHKKSTTRLEVIASRLFSRPTQPGQRLFHFASFRPR